jgi:hypothetical protein
VLHTEWGEAGPGPWEGGRNFHEMGLKAVGEAIHSYGWYWMLHRKSSSPSGADVDSSTNFQCFVPGVVVPRVWHAWIHDTLTHRIVTNGTDTIHLASHLGDLSCNGVNCNDYNNVTCTNTAPYFFSHPYIADTLSQIGAKAADERCGVAWATIDNYYYRSHGHVVTGTSSDAPPTPATFATELPGQITFNFVSRVNGVPVAWKYVLQKYVSGVGWRTIRKIGFNWKTRTIPISTMYSTSACAFYRVKATNPLGSSRYSDFGGGPVCG